MVPLLTSLLLPSQRSVGLRGGTTPWGRPGWTTPACSAPASTLWVWAAVRRKLSPGGGLSVCVCIKSVCLCFPLQICLSDLAIYLSICPSFSSVCLSISLYSSLSISIYLSVCLSVWLSLTSVHQSLPPYRSICLSLSLCLPLLHDLSSTHGSDPACTPQGTPARGLPRGV